jgi:hypothetical protein
MEAAFPPLVERWLTLAAGKDGPLGRLLLEGEIAAMRHNLLKAGTSQPERLLIDRICLCYLQVQAAERRYLARMEDGLSFKEAEFYGKRMERAQKQYLNAIKALEQVRKLQRPQVTQLNMATNQINVAQAVEGDAVPLPGGATIVEAIPQEHAALLTNRAQAWEEGID